MVSQYLEISSRLKNAVDGSSDGASCNTFVVADSVSGNDGIAEMFRWCTEIPCRQGAPTLILSNIRPRGSVTSRGVETRGVCAVVKVIDEIVTWARRPGKKNSACVCFIEADHGDLDEWLSTSFTLSLHTVYLGVLIDPNKTYSTEILNKLVEAYEAKRIFINKIFYDKDGNALYPNVCNEIRQRHKEMCTLAAIKLHEMADLTPEQFAEVFAECAQDLIDYLPLVEQAAKNNPDLYSFSRQVGLGFVGMANFIGKLGTTYQEVVKEFNHSTGNEGAKRFWELMESGIESACMVQALNNVDRMFTAQPTAHTALRLSDNGFSVSPELSPIIGGTRASDGLVRVFSKSSIDKTKSLTLTFPSYVQTQEEVPYEVYMEFCENLMTTIDHLLPYDFYAHTFSHTFYGDKFTLESLEDFIDSNLGSLYYRLEPVLVSRDKTRVDELGSIEDVLEDDEEEYVKHCPIDPYERLNCESCSM